MSSNKINWKLLLYSFLVTFVPTFLSSLFISDSSSYYNSLVKPPLSPPAAVFGIVWPILYLLMAISLYLVISSNAPSHEKRSAYILYAFQIVLNALWSIIYFNLKEPFLAFLWLLLLLIVVLLMTASFYKINKIAGWLLIPYIAWLLFAGYLNLATVILNN